MCQLSMIIKIEFIMLHVYASEYTEKIISIKNMQIIRHIVRNIIVTKNVSSNSVVAGNPAKRIKTIK